jgi:hypothetical protein
MCTLLKHWFIVVNWSIVLYILVHTYAKYIYVQAVVDKYFVVSVSVSVDIRCRVLVLDIYCIGGGARTRRLVAMALHCCLETVYGGTVYCLPFQTVPVYSCSIKERLSKLVTFTNVHLIGLSIIVYVLLHKVCFAGNAFFF